MKWALAKLKKMRPKDSCKLLLKANLNNFLWKELCIMMTTCKKSLMKSKEKTQMIGKILLPIRISQNLRPNKSKSQF